MRQNPERAHAQKNGVRGTTMAVLVAAVATFVVCGAASPALASLRQDLQRFSDCPYTNPEVRKCLYSTTTSGEFVIGKSTVPINKTVTIQGGIVPGGGLAPATDGNTLSKTPLTVPGGLVGIELPGNFTEVTATAELAGPAMIGPPVVLPLKVKLDNLLLGGSCYIGSESEPLALNLIYGTTAPPPPNKPIKGSFALHLKDQGQIIVIEGTLVDNSFAAPGANGCTLLPLVGDLAVNTKVGLPSPAGTNTAIMGGGATEEVPAGLVAHVLPLPELGRCQKLAGVPEGKHLVYHGAWRNSSCTEESSENVGKYGWTSGPGPSAKFKDQGTTVKLETVGKSKLTCAASTSEGEYTGPKTETVALTLTGCQSKAASCQSSGANAGEIRSAALSGSLDFIKENEEPAAPLIGVDLKPASGSSLMTFECAGAATSVGGSVIVPITAVDKMATAFKLKAKATGGKQSPEEFEGAPKDTLTFGPGAEQAGLTTAETRTNEESLEIKGAPNP